MGEWRVLGVPVKQLALLSCHVPVSVLIAQLEEPLRDPGGSETAIGVGVEVRRPGANTPAAAS